MAVSLSVGAAGVARAKNRSKADVASDFAKLVDKWQKAKAQGPLKGGACSSLAKDFDSFGDDNKSAESLFDAGAIYESCGDLKNAEEEYRSASKVNPKFGSGTAAVGLLRYRANDVSGASSLFDEALRADPKCSLAYYGQALVIFDRARQSNDMRSMADSGPNGAVGKLRRALALDADNLKAYALLALIYYTTAESDRSKLDLAELVCKQAKEVDDKYAQIYNVLGLIKLRKKNVTGALQEFKTAVQYEPHFIEAQLNIGAITLSARDYKTAETAFQAVLDAKPQNPQYQFDATMGMGVALRGQRRVEEAEKWYQNAKQLDGRACAVSYNLGILNQDYKQNSEADLNKAKGLYQDFVSCGRADADRINDAKRRIKDIDDTFKAMAEAKKLEEESKKLQEEAERMQKQQEEQMKQQEQKQAAPNGGGGAPPAEKAPPAGKK